MTEVRSAVSRGQFLRNGAKGTLVLATSGGILASMDGIAFAKGVTKSDIATLQVGYIAESLARFPDRRQLVLMFRSQGFEVQSSELFFCGIVQRITLRKSDPALPTPAKPGSS